MVKPDLMFTALTLVGLMLVAFAIGVIQLPDGRGVPCPPNDPDCDRFTVSLSGQVELRQLDLFTAEWKILNVRTSKVRQTLPLSIALPDLFETGNIVIKARGDRFECTEQNLGTFDTTPVVGGGVKDFRVTCPGLPHGTYSIDLILTENGNPVKQITKNVVV